MQNSGPAHRRLYDISEVSCPDSCNRPQEEKGCHFRMGPDRFTCTKCQLRIWRNFLGYELTPTDLQEMLHGDKVTSSEKTLTRKKDGQEITIRGRLMFDQEYRVRLAPKIKSKLATEETCPKCGTGKLQLITSIDDSKWYGCSSYPQCRFTKTYLPHTFKPATPETSGRVIKSNAEAGDGSANGQNAAGDGHGQASTVKMRKGNSPQKTPNGKAEPKKQPGPVIADNGAASQVSETAPSEAPGQQSSPEKYRHIPRFILEMLHLAPAPEIVAPEPSRPILRTPSGRNH